MCVLVMCVLSSPWYGPESFERALQHDSKLLRSQRIICPKHCFITTEYIEFLLHFQNELELGGRAGCVVRGGKCLCQSADVAGYTYASFSWHFVSMLS